MLATVSDRKLQINANNADTVDYYIPDVMSANDYYPFGMLMVGRTYSGSNYRYGFNGKEKSDEIFTEAYSFEARVYDSRTGRFLSSDPRESEYSWQSTYAYFSNSPISRLDFNGEGDDDKQKVKAYTNPDIKIFENNIERIQNQYQKTRAKYFAYYENIGKISDKSSEVDFQNTLSPENKKELTRLSDAIASNRRLLSEARAIETQWNKLDRDIEDVVYDFNTKKGLTGDQRLDPNLLKALMFSETEMGTSKEYKDLVDYVPSARPGARYQLNLGRVTDADAYNAAVDEFSIPIDWRTNYLANGNKNDVMLAAGALIQKLDYTKTVKSSHFKNGMPWFNAVVAYKGVSAEGARKTERVWKLYTTGAHPYTPGVQLFKP